MTRHLIHTATATPCPSPEEGHVVDGPLGTECRAHGYAVTVAAA